MCQFADRLEGRCFLSPSKEGSVHSAIFMNILFEANFDGGDFSEWDIVSVSGLPYTAQYRIQDKIVHEGKYAARLAIAPFRIGSVVIGASPGIRLAWHNKKVAAPNDPANLPNQAYYSAWYLLPTPVESPGINIMQWKQPLILSAIEQTREPTLNVQLRGASGYMGLCLRHRVDEYGQYFPQGTQAAENMMPLPVGEWFEIKSLYEWSKLPTGRVATWLNNQLLWNVSGIRTEFSRPFISYARQWTVNNYAPYVKPSPYSIYIDSCSAWTE